MLKGRLHRFALAGAVFAPVFAAPASAASQADQFAEKTAQKLAELKISASQVESIRYVLKRNMSDRGPDILGAEAWIRLADCSGYLVVQMNRVAYVRQTYTRGDCQVEGVTAY